MNNLYKNYGLDVPAEIERLLREEIAKGDEIKKEMIRLKKELRKTKIKEINEKNK
jgi:hypothetical protein